VPETAEIGSRLRAARERRGWNREALAFHSGISWSAIAQIETGRRRNVRPRTLTALSDALGVSIDYLVAVTGSHRPICEHSALIYDSDDLLLKRGGAFLMEASERGEAVLAVLSDVKIDKVRRHLGHASKSIEFVDSAEWLTTPGAALGGFQKFCVDSMKAGAPWVRVLGEPVWEGRSNSEVERWTRFESLLNLVFASSPISMLCPYDARALDPKIVDAARATHPHTAEETGAVSSPEYADPASFVLDPPKAGPA
jgi:transcriptional regulator with XRE-family HTH domain